MQLLHPKMEQSLIKIMVEQFAILADKGLTAKEIAQSKDQLKGGLLLNLESTANVMSKLGRTELALGKIYNAEETAAKLMAVTEVDIQRTINKLIVPDKLVLAQVGPQQANINLKEPLYDRPFHNTQNTTASPSSRPSFAGISER